MTCVIVHDACSLIDLRKGQLLQVMLKLPYRFVVPLPIRLSELLDFTDREWRMLDDGGVATFDLPADRVREAVDLRARHTRLSANDCFCLVSACCHEGSILLTGDKQLRRVAVQSGVAVHGVLWIVDELRNTGACPDDLLARALESWLADISVFLPKADIETRLRGLR